MSRPTSTLAVSRGMEFPPCRSSRAADAILKPTLCATRWRVWTLAGIKVLIIENVGNLVCPSNYDLGEAFKVVVASTTEGDDKPLKYPAMFRNASVLIINKIDLLPYVNSDVDTLQSNALAINPALTVFRTSCTTGEGIERVV